MPSYLYLNNIGKRYGDRWVFRGINLELKSAGIYGILGDNGVGKTTLIKIAAGLLKPSEGDVYILGRRPFSNPDVKLMINVLMHENIMYDELSVEENLDFYAKMYGYAGYRDSHYAVDMVDRLGLDRYLNYRLGELSFGWRKRVNIVRAFINHPSIVLFDEPTIGLDMDATRILIDILVEYSKENCILFTVSDISDLMEFYEFCDGDIRIFRLVGGGLENWSIE